VEINASDIESQDDLMARTSAAAFIGTLQASYTDFHYLRSEWKKTTEKEALLGIGMTGIASGAVESLDLEAAAEHAKRVNAAAAGLLNINRAARVTCVKPSGTTSLVVGTSSGIHAWHDKYYVRRVRVGKNEAMYTYLSIMHPELLEDDVLNSAGQSVISIPQMAPEGAITRNSENAIDFLNRIKNFHGKWIKPGHITGDNTHNVSATVTVKNGEWESVGEWMWQNKDSFNGLSFMPEDLGSYQQTPFETITEEEYHRLYKSLQRINVADIVEMNDNTNMSDNLACSGGNCEII
jgi:ribonucleoside-diphosphate reductase alpha chain